MGTFGSRGQASVFAHSSSSILPDNVFVVVDDDDDNGATSLPRSDGPSIFSKANGSSDTTNTQYLEAYLGLATQKPYGSKPLATPGAGSRFELVTTDSHKCSNLQDRLKKLLDQRECSVSKCSSEPFGHKQGMKQHLRAYSARTLASSGALMFLLSVCYDPCRPRTQERRLVTCARCITSTSWMPSRGGGAGSCSAAGVINTRYLMIVLMTREYLKRMMFKTLHLCHLPTRSPSVLWQLGTPQSPHTQYSEADIVSATQQLVEIFCTDAFLYPLHEEAIRNEAIGAERFAHNFRRLLKVYSSEPKDEAGGGLARLIRWKARDVAEIITKRYDSQPAVLGEGIGSHKRSIPYPTRARPAKDNSDDEGTFEEGCIETLAPVRGFLIKGAAFENLKAYLEVFIRPPVLSGQHAHEVEDPREIPRPATTETTESWYHTFTNFAAGLGLQTTTATLKESGASSQKSQTGFLTLSAALPGILQGVHASQRITIPPPQPRSKRIPLTQGSSPSTRVEPTPGAEYRCTPNPVPTYRPGHPHAPLHTPGVLRGH